LERRENAEKCNQKGGSGLIEWQNYTFGKGKTKIKQDICSFKGNKFL
jgi:hypothetical protein